MSDCFQSRDGRNTDRPTWCRGLVACLTAAMGVVLLAIGVVIAVVASYSLIDKLLGLWRMGLSSAASLRDVHWMAWIVGLVWTACFVRIPNLLPLAIAHGWLGTLAYYWLLERPPLASP